ncbi:benzoate/H(+) symporter BenE family transporter [Nitrincola tapanii]|uniref:Benzoate/H(+) symporter BenE family transporter n=1 Tax=Nitrincola tapanii TaxID=1708751 RepID=A0A5A9W4P1_9GAMM|nr:benzoate/H(+) symporter BenE family transporter [Nitrincola tapanii]KAA0875493.1 benzoate/H(+) symporter BenE family transporter [Nitrincola tapanii]
MLKDLSLTAIVAGLMAVLVSYSGPLAILIQAANNAQISADMLTSWIWAISIGAAISGIGLSLWLKVPVVTAWSAPGTVLLVSLFPGLSLNEAVAAYITAAALLVIIGVSGLFERIMAYIPKGVAAAMMAGILFEFGLGAFQTFEAVALVTVLMLFAYILLKKLHSGYFLVLLLGVGIFLSLTLMQVNFQGFELLFARPQLIEPHWTLASTLSLALPLVVVSLSGQFLPGFAILKTSGYPPNSRQIISVTGLVSLPMALYGGITNVIAAITASLCTSAEAHPDPDKRYIAGIANGVFYLIGGVFAGSIVLFFQIFPAEMIAIIAGLALLGAISNSLSIFVAEKEYLDASLITFLVTASGVSLMDIGAAFWGLVLGCGVYYLSHRLPGSGLIKKKG